MYIMVGSSYNESWAGTMLVIYDTDTGKSHWEPANKVALAIKKGYYKVENLRLVTKSRYLRDDNVNWDDPQSSYYAWYSKYDLVPLPSGLSFKQFNCFRYDADLEQYVCTYKAPVVCDVDGDKCSLIVYTGAEPEFVVKQYSLNAVVEAMTAGKLTVANAAIIPNEGFKWGNELETKYRSTTEKHKQLVAMNAQKTRYTMAGITFDIQPTTSSKSSNRLNCVSSSVDWTAIIVPEGVTDIGGRAFSDIKCNYVELPASLRHLESCAFFNCEIGKIVFKGMNIDASSRAFTGCTFKDVQLPSALSKIDAYMFFHCRFINPLVIPPFVTTLEDASFWMCSGRVLLGNCNVLERIGSSAFGRAENLLIDRIPPNLKWAGIGVFDCQIESFALPRNCFSIGTMLGSRAQILNNGQPVTGPINITVPCEWGCSELYTRYPYSRDWQGIKARADYVSTMNTGRGLSRDFSIEHPKLSEALSWFKGVKLDIRRITLPQGFAYLPAYSLSHLENLREIVVPVSLQGIEPMALYKTNPLVKFIPADPNDAALVKRCQYWSDEAEIYGRKDEANLIRARRDQLRKEREGKADKVRLR